MNKKGFTLIEILIVITIIGLIMGIGIPTASRVFRTNLKTTASQLAGIIRFAYDLSIVEQKTYRLVFDFSKNAYFLEVSNGNEEVLLESSDEEKPFSLLSESEKKKASGFQAYPGDLGKPQLLPNNLKIENIYDVQRKVEQNTEVAYLYFFPQGQTQELIIRLNGEKGKTGFYSLWINPINGKCKIEGRYVEP